MKWEYKCCFTRLKLVLLLPFNAGFNCIGTQANWQKARNSQKTHVGSAVHKDGECFCEVWLRFCDAGTPAVVILVRIQISRMMPNNYLLVCWVWKQRLACAVFWSNDHHSRNTIITPEIGLHEKHPIAWSIEEVTANRKPSCWLGIASIKWKCHLCFCWFSARESNYSLVVQVVTPSHRAPEVVMSQGQYTSAIDM